ncbi:YbdK family carboxylate-amine ligase [Bdellovibrio sp. HCB337]|uniref:carboxylate-amine ligase n=1 Tax=Bdellovibrio sp. HCB337 TaxID=3394358 RepID=UPI0039A646CB
MQFQSSPHFTLGVEQEIQLIDPETRDLKSSSLEILTSLGEQEKVTAEIFQSMIEVRTGICKDADEVLRDLRDTHRKLLAVAESKGVGLASSGSHPFSRYVNREVFPSERYQYLIDRNQWLARRLLIFGLHVHVGMPDGDTAIRIGNRLWRYLPLLLAMSSSSPYWDSQDTGLSSCRITVFEAIPTGGHPCMVNSWQEFVDMTAKLRKSKGIGSLKDIWWDVRPNPDFGTLELRICDIPHRIDQIAALAALVQLLAEYLHAAPMHEMDQPEDWWVRENKWRASRHGLNASFIISRDGDTADAIDIWGQLKRELQSGIEKRNYGRYIETLDELFASGTCADAQRRIYAQRSSFIDVVDFVTSEHKKGLVSIS